MTLVTRRAKSRKQRNVSNNTSKADLISSLLQILSSSLFSFFLSQKADLNGVYWWSSLSSSFQLGLANEGYPQEIRGSGKGEVR